MDKWGKLSFNAPLAYIMMVMLSGGIFINFQEIKLEHKPIFDAFFRRRRYEGAECTFTNMFMWRKGYDIRWTLEEGFLCIKACRDGVTFVLPPFGPDTENVGKVIDKMIDYFQQNRLPFLMKGVSSHAVRVLQQYKPGRFNLKADRDNFDYVYNALDLIQLSGRKYHAKKNHANSFRKNYPDYRYLPLTEELVEDCIQFAFEWCEKRNCDKDPSLICERDAIVEALRHFTYLDFQGGVIMVDGKVEAFTFGEALNEDTAVIHAEKANQDMRGLYAVINQEFCQHNWQHMKYINREEDMGIEGLRKAKESYHPVKMVEKYIVTLSS